MGPRQEGQSVTGEAIVDVLTHPAFQAVTWFLIGWNARRAVARYAWRVHVRRLWR